MTSHEVASIRDLAWTAASGRYVRSRRPRICCTLWRDTPRVRAIAEIATPAARASTISRRNSVRSTSAFASASVSRCESRCSRRRIFASSVITRPVRPRAGRSYAMPPCIAGRTGRGCEQCFDVPEAALSHPFTSTWACPVAVKHRAGRRGLGAHPGSRRACARGRPHGR